ncbi:MAG: ACP synthase [Myxococcota bacterium]
MTPQTHLGELELRRLFAGELGGDDATHAQAHAHECGVCRSKLKAIEDEQRRFEKEISFERFAAGVERAQRAPRGLEGPRARWLYPVMGLAAAAVLTVAAQSLIDNNQLRPNRTKGGAGIDVVVGGPEGAPTRVTAAGTAELLGPGERVRIGYQAGERRFVLAVAIDDRGEVSPVYPEAGPSLPALGGGTQYLPGSFEFVGPGSEQLIVVLSDEPLEVEAVLRATRKAFEQAKGDLSKVKRIDVPGEQFHRMFLKSPLPLGEGKGEGR